MGGGKLCWSVSGLGAACEVAHIWGSGEWLRVKGITGKDKTSLAS